jgi:thioredoxin 1
MAQTINTNNIEALVATGKPIVLDFWATWCGPCKRLAPIIEEVAKDYDGRAIVGKCDVEEDEDLAMRFGVRNIPTVVFLKDGQEVDRSVGLVPRAVLEEKINAML